MGLRQVPKGLADGRRRDGISERGGERVHRAPAGAMRRRNALQLERRQRGHCLRDDSFGGTGQVKTTHYAVPRHAGEAIARVCQHVDDAGVGTGGEHEHALVLHPDHDEAFVDQQRVGLPPGVVGAAVLALHPGLERSDTRDLVAHEEEVVEHELRLGGMDDESPCCSSIAAVGAAHLPRRVGASSCSARLHAPRTTCRRRRAQRAGGGTTRLILAAGPLRVALLYPVIRAEASGCAADSTLRAV